jgi:branched-subunit amino acid permease
MTLAKEGPSISLKQETISAIALGSFVGSLGLSALLQIAACALVFVYPSSVWVWTYVAFLVSRAASK